MGTNLDMDSLNNAMASTSLTEKETSTELPFRPQLGTEADKALDNIPRYLFRVSAPSSDAEMDGLWVHSKSVKQGRNASTKDIFSFRDPTERQEIAYQLNMHLRWWGNEDVEDNFVSWTSSLLFAIQYIYYRRHTDKVKPSFSDMHLYIIDTSLFPRGTFMCDLDLMRSFAALDYPSHPDHRPIHYNLANLQNLRTSHPKGYYFGEYLSQGSLNIQNKFQMIPANNLFENDRLRRLNPEFDNLYSPGHDNIKWAAAVVELRKSIWPSTLPLLSSAVLKSRLQAVKEIVDNVAEDWRFPIAIYLAALIGCESTTDGQGTENDNIFFQFFRLGTWDGRFSNNLTHGQSIITDLLSLFAQVKHMMDINLFTLK
jgi:hypothetical protein